MKIRTVGLALTAWGMAAIARAGDETAERPNVLIIVCDDLNDYATGMGSHPQARPPHIEKLVCSGVAAAGGVAGHPVPLIDLHPTLIDRCGLPRETRKNEMGAPLDGHSLRPFLIDPESGTWDGPGPRQAALVRPHPALAAHPLQQRGGGALRPRPGIPRVEQPRGAHGALRRHGNAPRQTDEDDGTLTPPDAAGPSRAPANGGASPAV